MPNKVGEARIRKGDAPVVSWLLPVRDGAPWLQCAVDSILADCAGGDEVIIVDDGSARPVREWLRPHPAVVVLEQAPTGIVAALERGRHRARGRFIARLDADDQVVVGRRDAQVAWLRDRPDMGAVGGRADMVDPSGQPVVGGMKRYVEWVNGVGDHRAELLVESPLFHPAVMFRADAVAAVGGYRAGEFPEDYDLWLRLAGAGYGLGAVDRLVVTLRDHGQRLTRTDGRYSRAAFLQLKLAWAAQYLLRPGMRIAVWGVGRAGRPWMRFVQEQGCTLGPLFDLRAGGMRHGVPVQAWPALADADFDLLLVCVGVARARTEIREAIGRLRPDLREGENWWAVT